MVKVLRFIILVLALFATASDEVNCQGGVDLDESKWEPLKPLLEKKEGEITFKLVLPAIAKRELENALLMKFDVVEAWIFLHYSQQTYIKGFTIKELEKSAKLLVDGASKDCIDFYDTWIEARESPVVLSIHGYLLFPKSINGTTTKKVILQCKGKNIVWDIEKINKMIEILK